MLQAHGVAPAHTFAPTNAVCGDRDHHQRRRNRAPGAAQVAGEQLPNHHLRCDHHGPAGRDRRDQAVDQQARRQQGPGAGADSRQRFGQRLCSARLALHAWLV